jgi:hypothetical protein
VHQTASPSAATLAAVISQACTPHGSQAPAAKTTAANGV